MTPFELLIIARIQVGDRTLLRRSLATQAAMERLAPVVSLDAVLCSLAGLGAGLDAELCRENPGRRGEVASELLRTEGAPDAVADAVLARYGDAAPAGLPRLAQALIAADSVVAVAYALMDLGQPLDELTAEFLGARLRRRAARGTDVDASRGLAALEALALMPEAAADAVLAGLRDARDDLRL